MLLTLNIFLFSLGLTPVFFMPVYVASKYSVVGYTKSVAVRLSSKVHLIEAIYSTWLLRHYFNLTKYTDHHIPSASDGPRYQ